MHGQGNIKIRTEVKNMSINKNSISNFYTYTTSLPHGAKLCIQISNQCIQINLKSY
jgi:hypothetical protein